AAARALHAIALRLGDADLRSNALAALTDVAWGAGDIEEARAWMEERLELPPGLSDPDGCHFAQMAAGGPYPAPSRVAGATRASEKLEELVQGLTPHHRIHGVESRLLVETLRGRWEEVRGLTAVVERTVRANAAAPCPGNAGALFYCALASMYTGDDGQAD